MRCGKAINLRKGRAALLLLLLILVAAAVVLIQLRTRQLTQQLKQQQQQQLPADQEQEAFNAKKQRQQAAAKFVADQAPWEVKRSGQLLIPQRLHHYFANASRLPADKVPLVTSWAAHHPNYTVYFWDAAYVEQHLLPRYPKYKQYYYQNSTTRFERDLIAKVLILFDYGGVFVDLHMRALANINQYIADSTCVMSQDRSEKAMLMYSFDILPSASVIACTAKHHFLKFFLRKITEIEFRTGARVLQVQSVHFIVHVYIAAVSAFDDECRNIDCDYRNRVLLAEPEVFLPVMEQGQYDSFRTNCIDRAGMEYQQREACYNLQANGNKPVARSLSLPVYENPWRRVTQKQATVSLSRVAAAVGRSVQRNLAAAQSSL